MAVRVRDVLKTSVVLVGARLLDTPDARAKFDAEVGAEVSESGIGIPGIPIDILSGPSGVGLAQKLALERDRITLELTPDRTVINRDYPSNGDLAQLAEIIALAIKSSNDAYSIDLRAIGFNAEVVYEQTSGSTAFRFLAERVFAPSLFQNAGYELRGGAARLRLTKDTNIWNISIEPRFNNPESDNIFASFNLHINTTQLPDMEQIKASLEEVWSQAHSIMDSL